MNTALITTYITGSMVYREIMKQTMPRAVNLNGYHISLRLLCVPYWRIASTRSVQFPPNIWGGKKT